VALPAAVLKKKKDAEQLWQQYMTEKRDVAEYYKWAGSKTRPETASLYDYTVAELAPGVFSRGSNLSSAAADAAEAAEKEKSTPASSDQGSSEEPLKAAQIPVPPPQERPPPPRNPLEHIKYQQRSALSKAVIQLGYFPNITSSAPRYTTPADVPRPVHPDEIEGPWEVFVTYDKKDGLAYVQSLQLASIDGATVLSVEEDVAAATLQPYAAVDPAYQEAVKREMAQEETLMQWPNVPAWKYQYDLYTRKHLAEVVQYNYSNVVDYIDREVLLTGRSVWESPIDIDHTCGGMKSVPAHAKKPTRYMTHGLGEIGVTDI
jgi:large subunit ribosomal protein L47